MDLKRVQRMHKTLGFRNGWVAFVMLAAAMAAAGCQGANDSDSNDTTGGTAPAASPDQTGDTTAGDTAGSASGPSAANGRNSKIVLITNGFSPFWDSFKKGMNDAKDKLGVSADWGGPPHADINEQKTLMEQYTNQGCRAMGVSAIEASSIGQEIDNLVARKIIMITFDSDAPNSRRLIYIGTNNYNAGLEAGRQMVKLLPQGGSIWGFVGNRSADNARDRERGFVDATKDHNIKLVDVLEDNKDLNAARQRVENVLQSNPGKVDGLLGFFSYDLPQIAQAVKTANLRNKIKIVGFDAEKGTLDALQSNMVDATVVQKPYEFGYLSVEFLNSALKNGADKAMADWNSTHPDFPIKDHKIDTGVEVVTPQNVAPFLAKLQKWGVQSS